MAVAPADPIPAAPAAPPAAPAPAAPPAAAPVAAAPAAPAPTSILDLAPKPPVDPAAALPTFTDGKLIMRERPAWLPENFHDKATGEVRLEQMAKSNADLRAQISRGDHKPPATAADYKLDFTAHADPDIKAAAAAFIQPGEDGKPDPVMASVQEAAHKAGVSQAGLQAVAEAFFKGQAAFLEPPRDDAKEMAKLGQNGPALLKNLLDFADGEVKYGKWDQADYDRFRNTYLQTADDAMFLQKLLQDSGRIPEVQIAALQQAAAAPDAAALDAEQAQLDADFKAGKVNDAQATERLASINERRAKAMGNAPTRQWPPPR